MDRILSIVFNFAIDTERSDIVSYFMETVRPDPGFFEDSDSDRTRFNYKSSIQSKSLFNLLYSLERLCFANKKTPFQQKYRSKSKR